VAGPPVAVRLRAGGVERRWRVPVAAGRGVKGRTGVRAGNRERRWRSWRVRRWRGCRRRARREGGSGRVSRDAYIHIYIAASQRRLAYTSHIKLQRTRAECTSGPQGQSVFFRPVTARPRRRQGARRSAESRRAPLGIVQWECCPSASRPRPGACLCLAHRGGRPCLRRRSLCRRLAHTGPCFCSYGLECHVEHPLRVEHPPACAKQSVFAPACAKSRGQLPRAETGGCT